MKQIGGFRMGPFELMDFIGNDVNYAVTESVFKAFILIQGTSHHLRRSNMLKRVGLEERQKEAIMIIREIPIVQIKR